MTTGTEDEGGHGDENGGRTGGDNGTITTTTAPPTAAASNCSQGGKGEQLARFVGEDGVTTMTGTRRWPRGTMAQPGTAPNPTTTR